MNKYTITPFLHALYSSLYFLQGLMLKNILRQNISGVSGVPVLTLICIIFYYLYIRCLSGVIR